MKVAVLGAGSWGSALAVLAARRGRETVLWGRDREVTLAIARDRRHPRRLAGFLIPDGVRATSDLAEVAGASIAILAVPSSALRETAEAFAPHAGEAIVVSAVKGFEIRTGKRMSEVAGEALPGRRFAALSGPTFAEGVVRGDPTAAVIASEDAESAAAVQRALSGPEFRLYRSGDVVGVELCGGLKNVIAIAAGIVSGLGLGHNTLAALVTRGLAEISRLVLARGGRDKTLLGLAGVGDLLLTCTGAQSRNRRLGEAIGRGQDPASAMSESVEVAEGTLACLAAARLASETGTELPIMDAVRCVLYDGRSPRAAIESLMKRELKTE